MYQIVTNNPAVYLRFGHKTCVKFLDGQSQIKVLHIVRDAVHLGAVVETHPIAGSIRPDQTPYCTVLLQLKKPSTGEQSVPLDITSLTVVEESMKLFDKFLTKNDKVTHNFNQQILMDFQMIDLDLFLNAAFAMGLK